MEYLFFLGGVFVGTILTRLLMDRKTGRGTFSVDPVEDAEGAGIYSVRVKIDEGQQLLDKKRMVLTREKHTL